MLLSLLTACSKTPPAPAPAENNSKPSMDSSALMPEDGAALKLWFDNDAYNEKIVELWNAKYPGVALTVENVGTTDARQKNELDGPTGLGADVFVMAQIRAAYCSLWLLNPKRLRSECS